MLLLAARVAQASLGGLRSVVGRQLESVGPALYEDFLDIHFGHDETTAELDVTL